MRCFLVLICALFYLVSARTLSITAAADLKFCLDLLIAHYKQDNPHDTVLVTYGSSGKAFTQLQQGAPFDLYFSADIEYPRRLVAAGLTDGLPRLYAIGRLVLWSPYEDASALSLSDLKSQRFQRIAIANPEHAPYGRRAEEALKAVNVWHSVRDRLVFGENISQTAHFVESGNASIGILALSLVKSPAFSKYPYSLIPDTLHQPLEQALVVMARAKHNTLAKDFVAYVYSRPAREIFKQYGFVLPGE